MATLEDKILGEKLQNYCSSSEESDGSDAENDTDKTKKAPAAEPELEVNKWEGTSSNTGPKGVLKDWQRYKQLENEKRADDEKERIELMKKLTLTVQSALDEEREKAALDDPDFAEMLGDEFLVNYQKQRMQEMLHKTEHNIKFGKLLVLGDGQQFLDAIDKEHKSVTVIVHIYENAAPACKVMNACLAELCKVYVNVKFCAILSSIAGMSTKFKAGGVPALLVYKSGQLVGNFIKLTNELGDNFQAEDVQSYLIEHGMLEDKSLTPLLIKQSNDSDSD